MKRERLTELVAAAAEATGYAFHTGEEHLINGSVRVYPAAWLAPPVVRDHSGRREGTTTWRTTLHLMTLPAEGSLPGELWRMLERDALAMVARLAASGEVCAVENIQCTPAAQSLTVHGECSVALVCDVTMWYYS